MRTTLTACVLTAALFAAPAAIAATTAPAAWPATRAGDVAKSWITAFNGGEDAMRVFLGTRMAAKSLSERGVPARVERYRELREEYGRLQLDQVLKSRPYEITARLLDGDAKPREFTFKSEDRAPWKLVSVSIKQPGFDFHHGFGGHGN